MPINGASGSVGSAAVQLSVARGAGVIATGSPATHDFLPQLRSEPIGYGDGMAERVRALAPGGVDLALDVAGSGVVPELIQLAGNPEHVITIADLAGAQVMAYGSARVTRAARSTRLSRPASQSRSHCATRLSG